MRTKLLLIALWAGVMFGQNTSSNEPLVGRLYQSLVGLPEYGVTLTGSVEHPEAVDQSGRTILAYVLWLRAARGRGWLMPVLKTRELRLALLKPTSVSGPAAVPPQSSISNGGPIVQATLEAVVFSDGQFVGPDVLDCLQPLVLGRSFDMMSARIDAERSLAQAVSDKHMSWDQLQALFNQLKETQGSIEARPGWMPPNKDASARHSAQWLLAGELLSARAEHGEAAALAMAEWTAKLPVLRKVDERCGQAFAQ